MAHQAKYCKRDTYNVPCHIWRHAYNHFKGLRKKLCEIKTPERIQMLAIPRRDRSLPMEIKSSSKCKEEEEEIKFPQIQIIRDKPLSTRLEQLALPQPRTLLDFKNRMGRALRSPDYRAHFNKLLHKSFCSVYTRLSKIKPPRPKQRPYRFNDQDWIYMRRITRKLSQPRKMFEPPEIERKKMPLKILQKRVQLLAMPREKVEPEPQRWVFTRQLATYKITERMAKIATAKKPSPDVNIRDPAIIPPNALTYKPTERTLKLAAPRRILQKAGELKKEGAFEVSPKALKYRPTARTRKLAKARDFLIDAQKDPTFVSPAAMKCKPSPRIIELAQPRKPNKE